MRTWFLDENPVLSHIMTLQDKVASSKGIEYEVEGFLYDLVHD